MSSTKTRAWMMDVGVGRRVAAGTHHVVEYLPSPETAGLPLIWREQIIPSLELARLGSTEEPARREWHGAVVLAYQVAPGMPLRYGALLVAAAPQETWVSNDMACSLPEESAAFGYFTSACFTYQEQAVAVVDTARLFSESPPWVPTPQEGKAQDTHPIEEDASPNVAPPESDAQPHAPPPVSRPSEPAATEDRSVTGGEVPLEEHRAQRRRKIQQIIAESLSFIHEEVGLKRVLLGILSRDGSVRVHYHRGVERDSPLRGFRFQRGDSSLFAKLVDKPQHVWVHAGNRERLTPFYSAQMREALGNIDFFASSIFLHSKLLGLCYADDFPSAGGLDADRYKSFKDSCNTMVRRLREVTA